MKATNDEWSDALDSLAEDKRIGPHLDEILEDLEIDLTALEQRLDAHGAHAFDALFGARSVLGADGAGEWSAQTPGQWLLGALLAQRTKSFAARSEIIRGDLVVTQRKVVEGDLEITGNLEVKSELFVMGNLVVSGWSRDTFSDIGHIVVAGDMKVGTMIFSEGFLMVGGRASAPLIALTFNQGFAKVLGGVAAHAVIEADHGGSRIFGPLDAPVVIHDELVLDDERDNDDLDDLTPLLDDDAADAIAGLDAMEAASRLMEHAEAGKRLFNA